MPRTQRTKMTASASEPSSRGPDAPGLDLLDDQPLTGKTRDLLGYSDYAQAIASLINSAVTRTPLTMAINAPWGAGKTSLGNLIEAWLQQYRSAADLPPHVVCWFNAWMHDHAPNLGGALASAVARAANAARPRWQRICFPIASEFLTPRQRWVRQVLLIVLAAVPTLYLANELGTYLAEDNATLAGAIARLPWLDAVAAPIAAVIALWPQLLTRFDAAARFLRQPSEEAARGSLDQVADQLRRLIHNSTRTQRDARAKRSRVLDFINGQPRRFVIIVDDLERCVPPKSAEVCEVASRLLGHEDVIVIYLADMDAVKISIQTKYESVAKQHDALHAESYGDAWLRKLVQFQLKLPPPRQARTSALLREFFAGFQGTQPDQEADEELDIFRLAARGITKEKSLIDLQGLFVAIVAALSAGAVLLFSDDGAKDRIAHASGAFMGGAFVAGIAASGLQKLRRFFDRRRATDRVKHIQKEMEKLKRSGVETLQQILERVEQTRTKDALVRERALVFLADESDLRQRAEAPIRDYLLPLPRHAKRMLNQLRFALSVAVIRQLVGGDGAEIEPEHLGRWIVLRERWPRLARQIERGGLTLDELERWAGGGTAPAALEGLVDPSELDRLADFFRDQNRLSLVYDQLVHMERVNRSEDVTPPEENRFDTESSQP